jgi:hypothetical protein
MCYEERKEQTPIHIMKFMCFLILQKIYLNNESIFKMVPNIGVWEKKYVIVFLMKLNQDKGFNLETFL